MACIHYFLRYGHLYIESHVLTGWTLFCGRRENVTQGMCEISTFWGWIWWSPRPLERDNIRREEQRFFLHSCQHTSKMSQELSWDLITLSRVHMWQVVSLLGRYSCLFELDLHCLNGGNDSSELKFLNFEYCNFQPKYITSDIALHLSYELVQIWKRRSKYAAIVV